MHLAIWKSAVQAHPGRHQPTHRPQAPQQYDDVIMGAMTYQITSITIVYSTVYSDADQGKHQSSVSLAFVRGIHRRPVNSPHRWPVTRKIFPFHGAIMRTVQLPANQFDGVHKCLFHCSINLASHDFPSNAFVFEMRRCGCSSRLTMMARINRTVRNVSWC